MTYLKFHTIKHDTIAALRESYGNGFARNAENTFDWKYLQNPMTPDGDPILDILECDDRIVGMNGRIPVRFKIGEKELAGVWNGDTHVVPDHRKASGWFAYQASKIAPAVSFGMPNPKNYAILSAANAVIDVARFTELKACLDLTAVLKAKGFNRLLSSFCGLVFSVVPNPLGLMADRRAESSISVEEVPRFDGRLDELWQAVSQDYSGLMVRDQKFLSWRFDRCPNRDYTRYIAERDGKIVGYMVTRGFRWGGFGRGRIVDYLVRPDDPGALSSLLRRVIRDFRSRGIVSVVCSIYTTRKNQIQAFRQHGFLYSQPGSQICVDRSSLQQTFAAIDDWFFTYADGDIDYCDDYSELEGAEGEGSLPSHAGQEA